MEKEDIVLKRDVCLEVINKLEAVKRYKLKDTKIVNMLVDFAYRYNIRDFEYLNTLVGSLLANQGKDTEDKQMAMKLTPDVLLTSDFLAKEIMPWVELVRKELFDSPSAPFTNPEDTEKWILQEKNNRPALSQFLDTEALEKAFYYLNKAYQGYPHALPELGRNFEYLGADGKLRYFSIYEPAPQPWFIHFARENPTRYTPLAWLESETSRMSNATGFTQPSLIQFVLIGITPILPRYTIMGWINNQELPSGEAELQSVYVNICIRAQDLTFEELRDIYNSYRDILRLKKHKLKEGKELAKSHWELYQLVKGKGNPPQRKGTVAFWEAVKADWNRSHPSDRYKTWKGAKLQYDRVISQLERRVMPGYLKAHYKVLRPGDKDYESTQKLIRESRDIAQGALERQKARIEKGGTP